MNWKKLALVSIALIALATIATAWALGNSLTPAEFAAKDLDEHEFNPALEKNEIIGTGIDTLYRMNFKIDTYEKQSDSENYVEVNESKRVLYPVKDYALCRYAGDSDLNCLIPITEAGIEGILNEVGSERRALKKEQIAARAMELYAHELTPNSVKITEQEIDAAK